MVRQPGDNEMVGLPLPQRRIRYIDAGSNFFILAFIDSAAKGMDMVCGSIPLKFLINFADVVV